MEPGNPYAASLRNVQSCLVKAMKDFIDGTVTAVGVATRHLDQFFGELLCQDALHDVPVGEWCYSCDVKITRKWHL